MDDQLSAVPTDYKGPRNAIERVICRWLFDLMITDGRVAVDYGSDILTCSADFVIACPNLWSALKIAFTPNLSVGETYVSGDWFLRRGRLADFLSLIRNRPPRIYGSYYRFFSQLRGIRFYFEQFLLRRHFTRRVRNHYDLDSAIYEMILDEELIYTCGFFEAPTDDLTSAQQRKIVTVLQRLNLPPRGARVLDVGCGWGAIERALVRQRPDAEICGLTISNNQLAWAKCRDHQLLTETERNRIEYRLEDFSCHPRQSYYDGVCVIGMIEHVGLGGYQDFFDFLHAVLKPGGTAVVHTIVSPKSKVPSNRWMDKHIFVGGYAPSISELTHAIESVPMALVGLHLYPPMHYRNTIECWLENLESNRQNIIDYVITHTGHREVAVRTYRMWHFYLSGVRNMFDPSNPHTHQIAQICVRKYP